MIEEVDTMANIDDYKDRMTAPIGAIRIDPVTGKPIEKDSKDTKKDSDKAKKDK